MGRSKGTKESCGSPGQQLREPRVSPLGAPTRWLRPALLPLTLALLCCRLRSWRPRLLVVVGRAGGAAMLLMAAMAVSIAAVAAEAAHPALPVRGRESRWPQDRCPMTVLVLLRLRQPQPLLPLLLRRRQCTLQVGPQPARSLRERQLLLGRGRC